jgi:tRNA threonylcarbamoyl adenosine modification protein YjeE
MRRVLADAADTEAAGRALGAVLAPGDVVALIGDLGAGKTTFTRGIAVGAGVDPTVVTSPTFSLVNLYPGRVGLAHLDLYRLEDERALDEIGFDDAVESAGAAAVIEWADRFADRLPRDHLWIELGHADAGRTLVASANGPRSAAVLEAWAAGA